MRKRHLLAAAAGTLLAAAAAAAALAPPGPALAQGANRTELTVARFFGTCDAEYGANTDLSRARGECGIITTLINKYNAENRDGVVVRPQVIEWRGYYDALAARFVARDVPAVAIMHTSILGDFVQRRLVEPLDADLRAAGVDAADFTPSARSVVYDGRPHALPWDTAGWLWHINTGLMRRAGLTDEAGAPRLPASRDELLAMARQFRERTGLPMLVQQTAPDVAGAARTFYTLLHQRGGTLFPDAGAPARASFRSAEVREVLETIKALSDEGHLTRGMNLAAANAAFLNGQGGVLLSGSWMIDTVLAARDRPDSPLREGYEVRVFPPVMGQPATWIDSHTWVLPRGGTNAQTRRAAQSFLRFMWEHNGEWARAGHLPARQSVFASEAFRALPMRDQVVSVAEIGRPALPAGTRRVFGIQDIVGEEVGAITLAGKPVDDVIRDAERRVNDLLANTR